MVARLFGRDRGHWLGAMAVLDALNALAPSIYDGKGHTWFSAISLHKAFAQPVLPFALLATLAVAFADEGPEEPLRRADLALLGLGLLAALLPLPRAGALAVALLGLWMVLTAPQGARVRRAGVIVSALAGTLVWGHLLLALVGQKVLALDGLLAGWFGQVERSGNVLRFVGSDRLMMIADGCSSLHNVTVSVLLWACLTQLLRIDLGWRSLLVCLGAVLANVAVNVVRLVVLVRHVDTFDYWHAGAGAAMFAWAGLIAAALVVYAGCYRLVAPRA